MKLKIFFLIIFCLANSNIYIDANEQSFYDLYIENISGDTLLISSLFGANNYAIIFYHGYNCFECIRELAHDFELRIKKDPDFKYIVLIRCPKSIIERKKIIKQLNSVFDNKILYFDIYSGEDQWPPSNFKDGLFALYNINHTPAVLENIDGELLFKPLEQLFPKR